MGGYLRGECLVPLVAAGEVPQPYGERGYAGTFGPGKTFDAVAVGSDGDNRGAVRRIAGRVEQGLQQRAGSGEQNNETGGQDELLAALELTVSRSLRRSRSQPIYPGQRHVDQDVPSR